MKVAHVCALLRRNVLGHRISSITLNNDPLLFPILKSSTNPEKELEDMKNHLNDSKIVSVGRHGKYFWLRLQLAHNKAGVLLMHFGMTGRIKIRNIDSQMIFMENGGDKKILENMGRISKFFQKEKVGEVEVKEEVKEEVKDEIVTNDVLDDESSLNEDDLWPPKFSKMEIELEKDGQTLEMSFADPRRLGRIRLLTGPEFETDELLLTQAPLNALGPDYSKSQEISPSKEFLTGDPDPHHHGRPRLSIEEFKTLIMSKKKPIKALLLDQAFFSGVGNWVADEIIYHARIHPSEILSLKLTSVEGEIHPRIQKLYDSVIYVCEESVRVEGMASKFPDNWLMLYRWGKARKKGPKAKTSEGYEVDYVTVGGRTSCFVPKLQLLLKGDVEPSPKRKKSEGEAGETKKVQKRTKRAKKN